MGHFSLGIMSSQTAPAAWAAENGASFDGTNDYLTSTAMTGIADSKLFIF